MAILGIFYLISTPSLTVWQVGITLKMHTGHGMMLEHNTLEFYI